MTRETPLDRDEDGRGLFLNLLHVHSKVGRRNGGKTVCPVTPVLFFFGVDVHFFICYTRI